MIAKGVTSDPVPAVVGTHTNIAFLKSLNSMILFLISKKSIAMSEKETSGCSYIAHMILAQSIGEPPPKAMSTSG